MCAYCEMCLFISSSELKKSKSLSKKRKYEAGIENEDEEEEEEEEEESAEDSSGDGGQFLSQEYMKPNFSLLHNRWQNVSNMIG